MVWTIFYFVLTSVYLAEAHVLDGQPCLELDSIAKDEVIYPPDYLCRETWLCESYPDGTLSWKQYPCIIEDCKFLCPENTVEEPPSELLLDPFDCDVAGAMPFGLRVFTNSLNPQYYWWCRYVDGEWQPELYKSKSTCFNGPCVKLNY